MAYRSYYKPKRTYRRSTTVPSPPAAKKFDVIQFLQNEFFNADEFALKQIFVLYKSLYGASAGEYLVKTYASWKHGHVKPSAQSLYRIIECVPPFLSFEKRFFILEQEIQGYAAAAFTRQTVATSQQLEAFYQRAFDKISNLSLVNISWFIGKGIIDEESARAILSACKHALALRLNQEVRVLALTLPRIATELARMPADVKSATYRVAWLQLTIPLSADFASPDIAYQQYEPPLRFAQDSLTRYIVEKLAQLLKAEKTDLGQFTAVHNQLQIAQATLQSLTHLPFEVDATQQITTAIGEMHISYKVEPLKILFSRLLSRAAYTLALIALPVLALIFVILLHRTNQTNYFTDNPSLRLLGAMALVACFLRGLLEIPPLLKQIKHYGQQRQRPSPT